MIYDYYQMIPGFDRYFINDSGVIRNKYGKRIATEVTQSGYEVVRLYKNNKGVPFTVHRLVAKIFIPNPDNKPQVNHLDGNKLNNKKGNLEWATRPENMRHSFDVLDSSHRRQKASERMSIVGKKYAKKNGDRLKALNIIASKPVIQKTMDGRYVNEFPSIKSAIRATSCHQILNVVNGRYSQSGGFKWEYK